MGSRRWTAGLEEESFVLRWGEGDGWLCGGMKWHGGGLDGAGVGAYVFDVGEGCFLV